jgi:plasmid stabilization system protein ParE
MRVRYTPRAFADREHIFDYLTQRSPGGALNVTAAIRDAVEQLGRQPNSGYASDLPDVRVKFIGRYPYKIFYRVREQTVEIVHIRHTARRIWRGGA